jgi:CxxC-x17-CxxC domain-containing protein
MHGEHGGAPLFKADFGPSPWDQRRGEGQQRGRGEAGPGRGRPQGQRYDAVCADCGASTQVPFRPNGVQPVWCRTCLPKHKTRRSGGGWEGSGIE